jgi:putative nucleotidyltransferase with HDIG domain
MSKLSTDEPARIDTIEAAVSLWDGLRGLSMALDLAIGRHGGHAQAVAALGVRVARRFGLAETELAELGLAALLKDAGCPSTRAPFASIVGLDDIAFHRYVFALEDYSPRTFAGLLWTMHQTQTDRVSARVVGWTRSLLGFKRYAAECARTARRHREAARIASRLDCPANTVAALAALGEHWDGSGSPGELAGANIPLASRILATCQIALIWAETATPRQVADRLGRIRPGRFDPQVARELARILRTVTDREPRGWIDELAHDCGGIPVPDGRQRPLDALLLASTFAEVVDVKSPFTGSHSLRVASLVGAMAALDRPSLGAGVDVSEVILTGLLHDLGKLGVPDTILDKQGQLTPEEWVIMRRHPADSARIIATIAPWARVATWAGAHHERIDGRGYHRGLAGDAIPAIGRLLATADAFDAMIADRPYRKGVAPEEALRRVREGRGTQFDPDAAELLEAVVNARGAETNG